MSAPRLARTLRERGVKTVLNLRGANPDQSWYRAERETALAAGATQVDVSMSSCIWMSRAQLRTLIRALDSCRYPLLVHCSWGSERTGLVSAFAELLRDGSTIDDARAQFSLSHLYVPFGDGKVMSETLDQYEAWLAEHRVVHRPEVFRRWAAEGYTPGRPDREQWAWDPYPLIVVTRPEPDRTALRAREADDRRAPLQQESRSR